MSKKKRGAQAATGKPTTSITNKNNTKKYDAFEEVLRRYAHRAAMADLLQLERGGLAWYRFLEATGTTCRDNAMQFSQKSFASNQDSAITKLDMNCPLIRGMIDMCGQQVVGLLSKGGIHEGMIQSLQTYGRPLPKKYQALAEHEMRVAHMNRDYEQAKGKATFRNTSNSVRKQTNLHTTKTDWASLTKIAIKDLLLYDGHEGNYIEGKLLVDPFTPMVGTTTILEDSNGDVILMALYNFLPDGLHGPESNPVASAKIPKGCTIRIVEPFQKVFRDGSRGIRVDNPNDISVISEAGDGRVFDEESFLSRAKMAGNGLVQKKMYSAASDTYMNGIRKADLVPTLLSNRSQAYAMLGDWGLSLADAAASLTMRPSNKKTWSRYKKAFEMISDDESEENNKENYTHRMRNVLFALEHDEKAPESLGKDAFDLKSKGNTAFKEKQYKQAASLYTSAILSCGETSRALLANYALCCLHSGANLDAVAASAASIRIRTEAKAIARLARGLLILGEPELCGELLESNLAGIIKEGTDVFAEKCELLQSVSFVLEALQLDEVYYNHPSVVLQKYIPRWIGGIETFDAGIKGRGVKAKQDVKAGQILLIEPPLALAETEGLKGKRNDTVVSMDKSDVKDPSQAYLRQAIILRSQQESVLSRIVDCLSDGVNKRPVTSVEDLIPRLGSCQLLLPSHYEYMPGDKLELTADRVDAIVSVNSHGTGGGMEAGDRFSSSTSTGLFAATSMFNHSARPNCDHRSVGGCHVTFAARKIKASEELTVSYHSDEDAVRRHWGITS